MSVAPGWYVDPADPATQRYWDGGGWIGRAIPADAPAPDGPPPPEPEPEPEPPAVPAAGQPGVGFPPGATFPPGAPGSPGAPGASAGWPPPGPHRPPFAPGQQPPPGWPPAQLPPGVPPYPGAPPAPHGMQLAGLGARLVARLIDFMIVAALSAVACFWLVWQLIQEISPVWQEAWRRAVAGDTSTENMPTSDRAGLLQMAILLVIAVLWAVYEVPAVGRTGQTFGKRLMGIKVVALESGKPVGGNRSLRRWNTFGLPTLLWYCCGLGLVLQLFDAISPTWDRPLQQALHDKRALTVVVRAPRDTPPAADNDSTPTGGTAP